MPQYLFQCPKCHRVREVSCPIMSTEEYEQSVEKVMCNKCRWDMKKIVAPSSFQLKGPGWAKDGYIK